MQKVDELFFFFFQAEDGIRDVAVTGVQTCALPIFGQETKRRRGRCLETATDRVDRQLAARHQRDFRTGRLVALCTWQRQDVRTGEEERSEERRVGKEWRDRRWTNQRRKIIDRYVSK